MSRTSTLPSQIVMRSLKVMVGQVRPGTDSTESNNRGKRSTSDL